MADKNDPQNSHPQKNEFQNEPQLSPLEPQPHLNYPLPPKNLLCLEDLINLNLNKLWGLQTTYQNIHVFSPMLSTLNSIVQNIETLIEQHNVALH